jgi:hypothetical protein
MGNQGMMFGNEPTTSTQVTIPKDVSIYCDIGSLNNTNINISV